MVLSPDRKALDARKAAGIAPPVVVADADGDLAADVTEQAAP
jgi:hypothetical protein